MLVRQAGRVPHSGEGCGNCPAFAVILIWPFVAGWGINRIMAKESIDRLAKTLAETLPESLRSVREDIESNFRSVLQSSLAKLDLVTREDFEVQEAVLAKARAKLEALEKRLATLEERNAEQD